MLEPTDQELIVEIRSGSDLAFDRMMRRYRRLVYRVAYGFTGDQEGAMDLVQETFLKVYTRLPSFRGEGKLRNWIARIAANEAMNWVRSSSKFEASELDERILSRPDERIASDVDGRENVGEALTRSLVALGPRQRLAIVLRYFGKRSTREIADTLECSEATARNILFRALAKLRTLMTESQESLR